MSYPGVYFNSLFYLGLATGIFYAGRTLYRFGRGLYNYFKSFGNTSKYTKSKQDGEKGVTYSAVIYGASTKVGKAYAYFLAKLGFNLILIERDEAPLVDLEANLKRDTIVPKIVKIVLDSFDQDTLNRALSKPLRDHTNSPVKIFVNCKNSRKKILSDEASR